MIGFHSLTRNPKPQEYAFLRKHNEYENDNQDFSNLLRMEKKARNFRDYPVWKDAVLLSTQIYKLTNDMPWFEKKGICDQLQRAVVSIASNIAEGSARPSDTEFAHFLDIALGSSYEVETQLLISKNIGYINDEVYDNLNSLVLSVERQLSGLIKTLRT